MAVDNMQLNIPSYSELIADVKHLLLGVSVRFEGAQDNLDKTAGALKDLLFIEIRFHTDHM